jgi:hypothetical protein
MKGIRKEMKMKSTILRSIMTAVMIIAGYAGAMADPITPVIHF